MATPYDFSHVRGCHSLRAPLGEFSGISFFIPSRYEQLMCNNATLPTHLRLIRGADIRQNPFGLFPLRSFVRHRDCNF
jgi:hypothetical protein